MKTPDTLAIQYTLHLGNRGKRISRRASPLLHSKFKASLDYMRPYLKNEQETQNRNVNNTDRVQK